MKIAVVGAGISGLSIANLLPKDCEILVLEASSKPGGLIQCDIVDDNIFHKVGGHVFNSKNPEVLKWFWTFFNKNEEFVSSKRNAKIYLQNRFVNYPIENFLYQLDAKLIKKIIPELIKCDAKKKLPFEYDNFLNYLEGTFGRTLCKLYFIPFNQKIWRTDLNLIPMNWLEGKLPMPNVSDIILSNLLKDDESKMVHSSFFYPKNNGSQFIADRLAKSLNVIYDYKISSIKIKENKIIVNEKDSFDKLIFTGNIKSLLNNILKEKVPSKLKSEVNKFKVNGTTTVLCSMDDNDMSWLYLPNNEVKPHRIIYTGNFSKNNNKIGSRKTCTVEFSGYIERQDVQKEIEFLPGNLEMIKYNYEQFSYIIHDKNTREVVNSLKDYLSEFNISLLGRFAEWEYYNMDKAIESAFKLNNFFIKEMNRGDN